ncbi:hypothetical protein ABZ671_18435 [Micromonospora sp. NPDC006766]|uniref:hypothetical protein n=1 Tax=Micromonospora sp. NPDC006766 TaxID=3154778 RepID=UPI0033D60DB8
MQLQHTHPTPTAHTSAHPAVRSTAVDTLPSVARADLESARATKTRIEQLEAEIASLRGGLGLLLQRLVTVHRVPKRALARHLDYASDNSVRQKTCG